MDYSAAVLALLVMNEITMLKVLSVLEGKDAPSRVPFLFRDYAKQKYSLVIKRYKNIGEVKPVPLIAPAVQSMFAYDILDLYRHGLDIKLTEAEWVLSGKWKSYGGANAQQFRDCLDSWSEERIVVRSNPSAKRSTWILARGAVSKLKSKLSPAPSSDTPKTGKKTG